MVRAREGPPLEAPNLLFVLLCINISVHHEEGVWLNHCISDGVLFSAN